MSFQFTALDPAEFADLFDLSDQELSERGAVRVVSDSETGFPCRVTLEDAQEGTELLLLNHKHLDVNSPYAASHAIYVAKDAKQATPQPGEVPSAIQIRQLSIRGFDADGMMQDAAIVEGSELADRLDTMFANPALSFVDVHFAQRGCFAARALRG